MTKRDQKGTAIALYLQGERVVDIARQLGVTERAVHRWLSDTGVREQVRQAHDAAISRMLARSVESAEDASSFVAGLVIDETAPLALRLQAARTVMGTALRLLETYDIVDRVQRLEAQATSYTDK